MGSLLSTTSGSGAGMGRRKATTERLQSFYLPSTYLHPAFQTEHCHLLSARKHNLTRLTKASFPTFRLSCINESLYHFHPRLAARGETRALPLLHPSLISLIIVFVLVHYGLVQVHNSLCRQRFPYRTSIFFPTFLSQSSAWNLLHVTAARSTREISELYKHLPVQ